MPMKFIRSHSMLLWSTQEFRFCSRKTTSTCIQICIHVGSHVHASSNTVLLAALRSHVQSAVGFSHGSTVCIVVVTVEVRIAGQG